MSKHVHVEKYFSKVLKSTDREAWGLELVSVASEVRYGIVEGNLGLLLQIPTRVEQFPDELREGEVEVSRRQQRALNIAYSSLVVTYPSKPNFPVHFCLRSCLSDSIH